MYLKLLAVALNEVIGVLIRGVLISGVVKLRHEIVVKIIVAS